MSIDPASGLVSWLPLSNQLGSHQVVVTASDPQGARASQSFVLPVLAENRLPVITSIPAKNGSVGAVYRYDVRSTDPDGDPLSIRLLSAPVGMTLDASTGRIQWIPKNSQIGPSSVSIEVSDGRGGVVVQNFQITVEADTESPVVAIVGTFEPVQVGDTIQIQVIATDNVGVAGRALTINDQPIALSTQGTASYTATSVGTLVVVATASDDAGNVGNATGQCRSLIRMFLGHQRQKSRFQRSILQQAQSIDNRAYRHYWHSR